MVEIRQEHLDTPAQGGEDGAKYRLIYAKSKVYVNPTVYTRDNIPGFVTIVKRVRNTMFSFLPNCSSLGGIIGGTRFNLSPGLDPRKSSD
jgi:hypothetical protein